MPPITPEIATKFGYNKSLDRGALLDSLKGMEESVARATDREKTDVEKTIAQLTKENAEEYAARVTKLLDQKSGKALSLKSNLYNYNTQIVEEYNRREAEFIEKIVAVHPIVEESIVPLQELAEALKNIREFVEKAPSKLSDPDLGKRIKPMLEEAKRKFFEREKEHNEKIKEFNKTLKPHFLELCECRGYNDREASPQKLVNSKNYEGIQLGKDFAFIEPGHSLFPQRDYDSSIKIVDDLIASEKTAMTLVPKKKED
jgi:hypothetical protein